MAELKHGIYAQGVATAGLTALIGTRLTPNMIPQDSEYPAVCFSELPGSEAFGACGADTGFEYQQVDFKCYATTPDSAVAVARQIKVAYKRYRGTSASVVIDSMNLLEQHDMPPETETGQDGDEVFYGRRLVFEVYYQEP